MRINRSYAPFIASVLTAFILVASPATATAPAGNPSANHLVYVVGTIDTRTVTGCTILTTEIGEHYDLIGGDPAVLTHGARVLMHGDVLAGQISVCMRGLRTKVIFAQRV